MTSDWRRAVSRVRLRDEVHAEGSPPLQEAMHLAYALDQRPAEVVGLNEATIRDGTAHLQPGKTGNKVRIIVESLFADTIQRMRERKAALRVTSLNLLVTERGEPLTQTNLRRLFDKARKAAAAKTTTEELRERILVFRYRDLRAKAGTDRDEKEGREKAGALLAHASDRMTDTSIRNRKGKLVRPSQGPKSG